MEAERSNFLLPNYCVFQGNYLFVIVIKVGLWSGFRVSFSKTLSVPQPSKQKQNSKASDKRKNWTFLLIENFDLTVAALNADLN